MKRGELTVAARPTPFADLNELLGALVEGARSALGQDLVGVYLVGSFALGEGDEHSDVDFIVVVENELDDRQWAALNELHRRLYERDESWAKHLEGSYAPRGRLCRLDPGRRPFLFLDNGASELIADAHCNTAFVRWILRRHGVTLAGPEPESLIEPVADADLRREAAVALDDYRDWAHVPDATGSMSQWRQAYLVLTVCRILRTRATGTIASKRHAATWALSNLDSQWQPLISRAVADRADPWARVHRRAEAELIDRTLAFVDHAATATRDRPGKWKITKGTGAK